jgi:hypothetical protein
MHTGFIKISAGFQKLMEVGGGGGGIHRQRGNHRTLLSFFRNKESRLVTLFMIGLM